VRIRERELETAVRKVREVHNTAGMGNSDLTRLIIREVQKLRQAGRSYPIGAVIRDADGVWYRRRQGGWVRFGSRKLLPMDYPIHPFIEEFLT
jgi:hypothetical protein